jgi:RimJ/RimL family protein N-acetyltransferase
MAGGVQDRAAAWRSFGHMVGHWILRGFGWFIVTRKDSDESLGIAGAHFPEGWPEKEIGWAIWNADDEGRGYASEAGRAVRDWVYRDLGWHTAVSYIERDNHRSIRLAERLGATRDAEAAAPAQETPCLVYRHPAPEVLR